LVKPTNLNIKDAASLHVVNILQHPTSHPATRTRQDSMVNAPKRTFRQCCYDMDVGENRVRVFYGREKREGERLEIYRRHQPLQP
jgi:hypothetical protein